MTSISEASTGDHAEKEEPAVYRPNGRSLGIIFSNVTALGRQGGSQNVTDLQKILSSIVAWPIKVAHQLTKGDAPPSSTIVEDISGVLFPGEMMLVLGRPGAGCSTVLRLLANQRESFEDVHGTVQYGGLSSAEMEQHYRSEALYCAEDDTHFASLSVKDTMDFAMRVRQPNNSSEPASQFSQRMTDRMLSSLGLSHTKETIVGDAFIRGISGGERKRISLAEVLAVNPAVASWDNPIRGLDSYSALSFLDLLRGMSRKTGMANAVTLYQASEAMYKFFDRVMLLCEGKMIFDGPAAQAKAYFVALGFRCPERQTTADFLTAITSPQERTFQPDYTGPRYETTDALAQVFRNSKEYLQLQADMARYNQQVVSNPTITTQFIQETQQTRAKLTTKSAIEISSIWTQSAAALRRQYRLTRRDWRTLLTIFILTAINAVIVSSAYYMAPKTATGSFERSGALFFSLVYFAPNALTEVPKTIESRAILLKQHRMGYLHPVALVIALAIADIPVMALQSIIFACCFYFTIGLEKTAGSFWIYILIVFVHFASISSLFRMLGAWSPNLNIGMLMGGCALPVVCLYDGYAPPVPTMHRWGSWIRRISPGPYGMEALMGNEYSHIDLHCSSDQLIPHGPGYGDIQHQGCPMPGAQMGSAEVSGKIYLSSQYGFSAANIWRDFGIIIVMWFLYSILTAVGLSLMTRETASSNARVFKRGATHGDRHSLTARDLEDQTTGVTKPSPHSSSSSVTENSIDGQIVTSGVKPESSEGVFVFQDVNYFVTVEGQERQLLNNVTGYVRPGQLTALMGASGAGKTTLLETISRRKTEGRTEGRLLFDNQYLNEAFSRSCGFCMQQDVHEPLATVRETLNFSAFMRQNKENSKEAKLQDVQEILELLELDSISDALVGSLGVEERKRVTIGVELCARPSALLFLDEPTSGLDSQAAHSIVSFLRKIAAQGTPIVCTIHQPSSVIFEMFDHALILAPGGRTVYFGKTGEPLQEYFARYDAPMGSSANPAEFVITTIATSGQDSNSPDWPTKWQASPECHEMCTIVSSMVENTLSPADRQARDSSLNDTKQFALPLLGQVLHLTKRHWMSIWRNGPYNFSKLFKSIFFLLLVSFTFFKAGPDANGLQNHALALLIGCWVIPSIAGDVQDIWFQKWAIFEARERNGIYDFKALLIALIAVETPWQLVSFTLTFFCNYWTVGYTNSATIGGFVYFMSLLLSLFGTGFCFLMAALFPNPTMAGYANSLCWVVLLMFNGIVAPHSVLNSFYRSWITWVDPLRYYFGATVSSVLHNVKAVCKTEDMATFSPPPGQTCGQYMQDYMLTNPGYLESSNATSICQYCPYSVGDDYSATLTFFYNDRWRDWAVFLGFCISNLVLVFFASWIIRVQIRKCRM
ncbi:hypothetical protein N7462_010272 [Penicillium macrosclerotiorum]|uniref:uncharacterized protein n=1 Tax=Penicillium macrosclerotiorum TaxID=303699 RepID=UPI0025494FD3|nr:uncharacterized protein N7462_010272 [Penicillium macrosclerotiorum]KAJ5669202.1 hypothetical protein N7462_010272 [Penicillium macrosclerotiorum]